MSFFNLIWASIRYGLQYDTGFNTIRASIRYVSFDEAALLEPPLKRRNRLVPQSMTIGVPGHLDIGFGLFQLSNRFLHRLRSRQWVLVIMQEEYLRKITAGKLVAKKLVLQSSRCDDAIPKPIAMATGDETGQVSSLTESEKNCFL